MTAVTRRFSSEKKNGKTKMEKLEEKLEQEENYSIALWYSLFHFVLMISTFLGSGAIRWYVSFSEA